MWGWGPTRVNKGDFAIALFPAFLKLAGRRVVVVGGGPVAASKLAALQAAGAEIRTDAAEKNAKIDAEVAKKDRDAFVKTANDRLDKVKDKLDELENRVDKQDPTVKATASTDVVIRPHGAPCRLPTDPRTFLVGVRSPVVLSYRP